MSLNWNPVSIMSSRFFQVMMKMKMSVTIKERKKSTLWLIPILPQNDHIVFGVYGKEFSLVELSDVSTVEL